MDLKTNASLIIFHYFSKIYHNIVKEINLLYLYKKWQRIFL